MYYRVTNETANPKNKPIEDRGSNERKLLLWLTLHGYFVGRLVALPFLLITAFVGDSITELSLRGTLGAVMVGCAAAGGALLLRLGNITSPHPAINVLAFMSPLLALIWLMAAGITLPRFDLFIVGAALILAVNTLIQLKPGEEHGSTNPNRRPRRTVSA